MNASAEWEDLVSTALVGTDRRPQAGEAAGEIELLGRAAVHTLRMRAGRRPVASEPLSVAAPEEQPAVSRAAGGRLARILGGEQPRLLAEWLEIAAGRGYRLSPHLLPELLDHAARDRSIRSHLGVLAGNRGRWLAGLNPAWGFLLEEVTVAAAGSANAPEVWEVGTSGDRRAHLAALRAVDPAEARKLLAVTWEKETPDDRAAFLEVLADGLSLDDEPFLEAVLDDRRREVRHQAADLLTRLPDSRLALRMAERVARYVTVVGGKIQVTPPVACDSTMERDGIRAKPPRGTGEKSWWLQQAVARASLGVWPRLLGHPPRELVQMKIVDWGREVMAGWVRATVLQGDPEWARELFASDPLADLLAALPPAEQEVVAAGFVRRHGLDGQLIMVLGGAAAPWGPDLAKAVLQKIIEVSETQPWNIGELAKLAGERIDPALCGMAERLSPEPPIQEVAALLRFRDDMLKELH
ncbi:DUF5691 domain-containing protein [Streptosporangium sp. 'caverna']|uniref:DUF5691 domain-containing protein n=1 Tax=Streptosporangium sp. 'caverna' TaxID=2202249 RepID=UPI000D7E20C4|nr:DUF5691 domain-containing protein [Streptosporangium sp. 'caverna']AWS45223.1 hypothetical protein DKM19_31815 [Streptosporangium sp. 'caverna']